MKRRAKGEGTIGKLADGRYVARLELGRGPDGKRRRKAFYGATKEEVTKKLRMALAERERGMLVIAKRQTVGQFLTAWLAGLDRKPSTMRFYRQKVGYLLPALGSIQLDKLTPEHVEQLLAAKRKEGLSPQSLHHIRSVLRTALAKAVRNGYVTRNVAELADPPRVTRYEAKFLTPDQARAFLAAAEGDRFEALFAVALSLGLRTGEALGLQWADIDLEAGRLTVNHALQRVNGKWELIAPKTDRSRRTLTMPRSLVDRLRAHRARQHEARLLMGSAWRPSDFVFTNLSGRPLDSSIVRAAFWGILAKAGLPRIRLYDLRHSCASLLLAQGVAPRTVMDILGHSTITLTMNTYSHVMQPALDEAASKMELVFGGR